MKTKTETTFIISSSVLLNALRLATISESGLYRIRVSGNRFRLLGQAFDVEHRGELDETAMGYTLINLKKLLLSISDQPITLSFPGDRITVSGIII